VETKTPTLLELALLLDFMQIKNLVGRGRFELPTNGLKVRDLAYSEVLICIRLSIKINRLFNNLPKND
jgi:hypothetical protein